MQRILSCTRVMLHELQWWNKNHHGNIQEKIIEFPVKLQTSQGAGTTGTTPLAQQHLHIL